MSESISTPGTNENVFIYEDMKIIGAYYPELETIPSEDTLYGCPIFFYDYYDFFNVIRNKMLELVESNEIKIRFKDDNEKNMFQDTGVLNPGSFQNIDKLLRIYECWVDTLTRNPNMIPKLHTFDNFFYNEIKNPQNIVTSYSEDSWVLPTGVLYQKILGFPADVYVQALRKIPSLDGVNPGTLLPKTKREEITTFHELSHFPPMGSPYNNMFDNVVFYDPENHMLYQQKFISDYGIYVGNNLASHLLARKQKVKLSKIVSAYGYFGLKIDFRPIGIQLYTIIDYDSMIKLDYDTVIKEIATPTDFKAKYYGHNGWQYPVAMIQDFSLYQWVVKGPLEKRDNFIQYLLKGGALPLLNQSLQIPFLPQESDIYRGKLFNYYSCYIELVTTALEKFIQVLLVLVSMIVAAVLAYFTGGAAAAGLVILTSVITIYMNYITKKIGEDFGPKVQLMVSGLFSVAFNKIKEYGFPKTNIPSEKQARANEAFKVLCENAIGGFNELNKEMKKSGQNNWDLILQQQLLIFDDAVTGRQQTILEMIMREKEERVAQLLVDTSQNGYNEESESMKQETENELELNLKYGVPIDPDMIRRASNQGVSLSKEDLEDIQNNTWRQGREDTKKIITYGSLGFLSGFGLYNLLNNK